MSIQKLLALFFYLMSVAAAALAGGYTISSNDARILENQRVCIICEERILFVNASISANDLGPFLGGIFVLFTITSLLIILLSLFRCANCMPMFTAVISALPILPAIWIAIHYSVYLYPLESVKFDVPHGEYVIVILQITAQVFYVYALLKQ